MFKLEIGFRLVVSLAVPFSIAFFSFISCYSFGPVLFICNTKNRILICTNKIDLFSSVLLGEGKKKQANQKYEANNSREKNKNKMKK